MQFILLLLRMRSKFTELQISDFHNECKPKTFLKPTQTFLIRSLHTNPLKETKNLSLSLSLQVYVKMGMLV